ncbi:MAG: TrmB family transcriptional regulator [Thaumarchaeota archaeon]|nr:TrmB family transcriptional regulator [Nitrososphaerota archaeon]
MKDIDDSIQINLFDAEPGMALYEHKFNLQKITEQLLKFGLTPNQAKIYTYLGKYGPKTAAEVFKALQLPRTETYFILNLMQGRGIVTAECSLPTKYSALPLEQTLSTLVNTEKEKLNTLTQQKRDMVQLWDKIPSFVIETNDTKSEKLQMVQGSELIHIKIKDMIKNAREEIVIFCSEKDLSRFYHADITNMLSDSLLDFKIIISPAQRFPTFLKGMDKKAIKVMANSDSENQCFVIKDNDESLVFLRNATHPSHNPFAVWADSKSLVESMHKLFEYSWENAEVCH